MFYLLVEIFPGEESWFVSFQTNDSSLSTKWIAAKNYYITNCPHRYVPECLRLCIFKSKIQLFHKSEFQQNAKNEGQNL